jgi:hypothetical protein
MHIIVKCFTKDIADFLTDISDATRSDSYLKQVSNEIIQPKNKSCGIIGLFNFIGNKDSRFLDEENQKAMPT